MFGHASPFPLVGCRPVAAPRPSPVYFLVALLSWPVVRFLFRLRWRGLEHVPREGGAVLAANHNSNLDPWPLGLPLFPRRFLRFMGKSELFWFPLGVFIRAGGAFKVRRGEADTEAIADGRGTRAGGPPRGDVPRGHAPREGPPQEARGAAGTRARRGSRSRQACRSCRRRSRGRTGSPGSRRCAWPTGRRSRSTTCATASATDAAAEATDRLRAEIERLEATL